MKKTLLSFLAAILFILNLQAQTVWQVSTIAGTGVTSPSGDGGNAINAAIPYPRGVGFNKNGDLIVSSYSSFRKISNAGVISSIPNTAHKIIGGGIGIGGGCEMQIVSFCIDTSNNIYTFDGNYPSNYLIKITPAGITSTIPGINFSYPGALCADSLGNIYALDPYGSSIMKVSPNGNVSTFYTGITNHGMALCADSIGNIYSYSRCSNTLLKINPSGVLINSYSLTNASSIQICADNMGNIYYTGNEENSVYKFSSTNNTTTKLVGNQTPGFSDGVGNDAKFNTPTGICMDKYHNLYVADLCNNRIRKIQSITLPTPPVPSYNNLPTSMCLGSNANYQPSTTGSSAGINVQVDSSIIMPAPKAICRNKNGVFVLSAADSVMFYDFNGNLQFTYNNIPWYANVTAIAADDNNRLYLAAPDGTNPALPNIYRLDAQGNMDFQFNIAPYQINSLSAMAFGPGYLYAVDTLGPYIHVIDTTSSGSQITITQLPLPSNNQYSWYKPTSMVFGSMGQMYLADVGHKTILARNASDNNYYVVDSLLGSNQYISMDIDTTIANSPNNNTFYITSNTGNVLINDAISRVSNSTGGELVSQKDTVTLVHLRNPMGNVYVNQGGSIPVSWIANSGGDNVIRMAVYAYSITPPLPAGLNYNFLNGKITGTPTTASPFTTYTIVTASSAGSNTTTIAFSVVAPTALSTATGTTSSAVVDQADGLTVNYFNTSDCSQMISIQDDPGGTVLGNTIATQTVYPTIATFNADQFVGRVTEVATQSPDSALAHVTLNFSYQDITNYNSSVAPTFTLSNDTTNTMLVGVLQTHTTNIGSIHPISHSPLTANWVHAAPNQGYWEVKFDVTKFSTFYMGDAGSVATFSCATGSADTIVTTNTAYYWHNDSLYFDGDYADTLVNAAGCDSICTLNLTFNSSTGIGTPLLDKSTSIYPNPSTGLLNININNPNVQVNNIRIVNLVGEEVYLSNGNNTNLQLDLSQLPKGYYMVTITSKQECINKRILLE